MRKHLLLLLLLANSSFAFSAQEPAVLLLNSYHPQYRWTDELTRGVQDTLAPTISAESLHIEFMDARRFVDDSIYDTKLIDLLRHKYQQYAPDIIITSDDHAYYFMLKHGDSLFPGIPIVFCGVNVFKPETLHGKDNIVGIQEGMEIEGNLDLILSLQPNTERIIMLGDTTGLGLRMVDHAKAIQTRWRDDPSKQKITLDIWDHFSLKELYEKAETVAPNSVFLMLAIHKDKLGNYFSFENELPILTRHSKVPVYGMWGALMIGQGVIGGMMNNPYEHGQSAAQLAQRILSGEPLANIGIQNKATYAPYFDYQQLQRFAIDQERLPKNSTVIDRPTSLYQQYQSLIVGVSVLVIFLIIVISVLVINIVQRISAQRELREFSQKLESTVLQRTQELDIRNKELETASNRMHKLAHTDILTGLSNRRAGTSEVEAFIQRYNINYQPLTLAILDIDHFKKINDTFGHPIGDEVLRTLGAVLKNTLRPSDRVYRWGGEEFLIVLPDTETQFATAICRRLQESIRQIDIKDIPSISVSIGVASFAQQDTFHTILLRADEALYRAKHNGRDQVSVG